MGFRTSANKYGNTKVTLDGQLFDSAAEARRWTQLKLMEQAGEIRELRRQPSYRLVPGFRDRHGHWERPIIYVADFAYLEPDEQGGVISVVEEVKGYSTPTWQLKRKLFLLAHPNDDLRIISAKEVGE